MATIRALSAPVVAGMLLLSAATAQKGPDDRSAAGTRLAVDALKGPIQARVERVIDGDTVVVRAQVWLGQTITVHVRIAGVDAPEMHARCAAERKAAEAARAYLVRRLSGEDVELHAVAYGKYAGRVLAAVTDEAGDIGQALIASGHARPYRGGRRQPWCAPA